MEFISKETLLSLNDIIVKYILIDWFHAIGYVLL